MKYTWLNEYLLAKRGVTRDLQEDWNWIRYQIGGKMFAAVLLDGQDMPYYINLKLDPLEGELMRKQYPDVIPGYYSNKQHWNSVKADGEIPDDLLKTWLDRSYHLVLKGFSRQKQREIIGLSVCGSDCASCPMFGNPCIGCNAACGKVFHTSGDQPCGIYACCAVRHRYATCASCSQLPCGIWEAVRDPSMTEDQFRQNITERISALKTGGLT